MSKFGPKVRISSNFSDFLNGKSPANPHKIKYIGKGRLIGALFEPEESVLLGEIMLFFILFLLSLLYGCDGDCPQTVDNRVNVSSNMKIDTIISPAVFDKFCSENECSADAKIRNLHIDTIPASIVVGTDTLVYLLAYEDMNNIFIVVDSVAIDCKSSHSLSGRGYNHYRVDSGNAYSCVFYFEPGCP